LSSYEILCGDALLELPKLAERGVALDACITDPPYGTTQCAWDAVIPFGPMWVCLKQTVKPSGAIVLFGSQPFTSALVMSNPQMFKYAWVWRKSQTTNFLNASKQPLRRVEDVCVFYAEQCTFNPQMARAAQRFVNRSGGYSSGDKGYRAHAAISSSNNGLAYPFSDIEVASETGLHPTQKPVELMRYLVRTYTNEGDTVLDFAAGSFSTGVACVIERRNFIGIEQSADYCRVGEARLKRASGIPCDMPRLNRKPETERPLFNLTA
jgi:site-specific DNA-methyltransferase (adenine-specific)